VSLIRTRLITVGRNALYLLIYNTKEGEGVVSMWQGGGSGGADSVQVLAAMVVVAVVIVVAAMEMVLPFMLPLTPLVTLILSPALHLDTSPTMEILIFHWLEGKMPLAEEGVLVCCLLNYFMQLQLSLVEKLTWQSIFAYMLIIQDYFTFQVYMYIACKHVFSVLCKQIFIATVLPVLVGVCS